MVVEEVIGKCDEEEYVVLDAQMGEQDSKISNCVMTEEVIKKLLMVITERLVLDPELKEALLEEAAGKRELKL